ncbi:hypothetical protein HYFRA_00008438 [Hymenoscyphus fraxineus]|uniref:F-box domain-containing protein n=1 Tax=Hymenoscyphus fraxineus TaxID=746836 RepID=A0A9N9KN88_9HELO|nr:hypothetical protein HYFRA_00008438 [Hymenoscyphus fraxineus]
MRCENFQVVPEWVNQGYFTLGSNAFEEMSEEDAEDQSHSDQESYFRTLDNGEKVNIKNACPLPPATSEGLNELMLSFYPIHVGCLSLVEYILRRKLEIKLEEKVPSSVAIQTFYYALDEVRDCLRELPDLLSLQSGLHTFGIEYPHGYYGMRRYWRDVRGDMTGWYFLFCDPFDIPCLTEYILSNLHRVSITGRAVNNTRKSPLETLPIELLHLIISYLPYRSILRLGRVNHFLHNMISADQTIWRNMLIAGSIVPFIFDLNTRACHERDKELEGTDTCWDWKLICRWLKEEPFVEEARRLAVLDSPVPRDQFKKEANQCFMGSMIELLHTRETKLFDPPLELANRVRLFKTIEDALMLKPRGSRGTEERYAFMKGDEEVRILGIVEFDKID